MAIKCAVMYLDGKPIAVYDLNKKHPLSNPYHIFTPGQDHTVRMYTDIDFMPTTLTKVDTNGMDVDLYIDLVCKVLAPVLARAYALPLYKDELAFFRSDELKLTAVRIHLDSRMDTFFPLSINDRLIDNNLNKQVIALKESKGGSNES